MREHSHEAMAFLLGATAGGVAALLLAPTSGSELRHKIGDEAGRVREGATDKLRHAGEAVTTKYGETSERAHRLVDGVKTSTEHYRHAVAEAVKEGVAAYERELGKAS